MLYEKTRLTTPCQCIQFNVFTRVEARALCRSFGLLLTKLVKPYLYGAGFVLWMIDQKTWLRIGIPNSSHSCLVELKCLLKHKHKSMAAPQA